MPILRGEHGLLSWVSLYTNARWSNTFLVVIYGSTTTSESGVKGECLEELGCVWLAVERWRVRTLLVYQL